MRQRFRPTDLLAVDPLGGSRVISDASEADPTEEFHLAFRQVMEPRPVSLDDVTSVATAGPIGSPPPGLAQEADRFRALPWLPDVGLVRFGDSAGAETWLGWNPRAGAWEEWDDPRRHYPGAPGEVLDPGGFTDPRPNELAGGVLPDDQLALRPAETLPGLGGGRAGPIEMDERHDPNVDHIGEQVESIEIDAGPIERLEDRSPSLGMDL